MVRRQAINIIHDILLICQFKPIRLNKIILKANISYRTWKKYSEYLISNHFLQEFIIDKITSRKQFFYKTTTNGINEMYRIRGFLNDSKIHI